MHLLMALDFRIKLPIAKLHLLHGTDLKPWRHNFIESRIKDQVLIIGWVSSFITFVTNIIKICTERELRNNKNRNKLIRYQIKSKMSKSNLFQFYSNLSKIKSISLLFIVITIFDLWAITKKNTKKPWSLLKKSSKPTSKSKMN
jgi:hypothetical protein